MTADMLRFLFDFSHIAITRNAAGWTDAESLVTPPAGNCANWVLGHIVAYRSTVLALLGEEPLWSEADQKPYTGKADDFDPARARSFNAMLADLEITQERVRRGLERMTPEDLAALAAPGDKRPRGPMLHFFQFHEAYHAGQLGLLRRIAGKPGAI